MTLHHHHPSIPLQDEQSFQSRRPETPSPSLRVPTHPLLPFRVGRSHQVSTSARPENNHLSTILVTGAWRTDHISPLLQELGWERIDEFVCRHDLTHFRRAVYDSLCPLAKSEVFICHAIVSSRRTHAVALGTFEFPKCRLSKTQHEFAYRANAKDKKSVRTYLHTSTLVEFKMQLFENKQKYYISQHKKTHGKHCKKLAKLGEKGF